MSISFYGIKHPSLQGTMNQHDPDAKLDDGKILAGVLADFSLALTEIAKVGTFGAAKYSRGGWQEVDDGRTRYTDALWRHLLAERHELFDPDPNLRTPHIWPGMPWLVWNL